MDQIRLVRRRRRDGRVPPSSLLVDAVGGAVQQGVHKDEHDPDEQRAEDVGGGAGEQEQDERDPREGREHDAVPDYGAARGDLERDVAEEVEEEPGDHAGEEDDEGPGVPEQGDEDDGQDDDGVVHGEVREVGAGAGVGVPEPPGHGQGPRVRELAPGPARR